MSRHQMKGQATAAAGAAATMTGGQIVAASLAAHGTDRVFCVPGESFLGIIDALRDHPGITLVACRHEGGAGFMAVADARLTGRPGVVMASRAPGSANVSIAVQTAQEDGVPLVVVVGQVERGDLGRGAFQEISYDRTYSGLAKAVIDIRDPGRAAEQMAQAFHTAARGQPGPVVVVVPEDMLAEEVAAPPVPVLSVGRPQATEEAVARVAASLAAAKRPLLIAGMALSSEAGRAALRRCADAWDLPVAVTSRQGDLLDNSSPGFVGQLSYGADLEFLARLEETDCILAVGTRLGDVTSQGYRFPAVPHPEAPLHHVHPSAEALGALRRCETVTLADPAHFLGQLARLAPARRPWKVWRDELHRFFTGWSDFARAGLPAEAGDGVVFGAVIAACNALLPDDAILTADAGNFGSWLNRYYLCRAPQRLLGPLSGAMGYGVPAAVAACLRHPERPVICFVGDGGMMMTGAELATALAQGAAPIIIVADNRAYGTIRMHQEKRYPGRPYATGLAELDFAGMAEAMGCRALRVTRAAEIRPALERALSTRDRPVLLHVATSLVHLSPTFTLNDS